MSSCKAKRDKISILAEMKELLRTLIPAMKHMPKIDRIDGAPMEMKRAAFKFIEHFSIAEVMYIVF